MESTYFTDAEARAEVGQVVEALSDFPIGAERQHGIVTSNTYPACVAAFTG